MSAAASALGALLIAVLVRFRRARHDWVWSWGAVTTAGLTVCGTLAVVPPAMGRTAALGAAGALVLYALASGIALRPLGQPWLAAVSVTATGWGWTDALVGTGWTVARAVAITAPVAGAAALAAAVLLHLQATRGAARSRRTPPAREWVWSWGALTGASVAICAVLAPQPAVAGRPAFLGASAGLVLYSVAASLAAAPLGWALLRWLAAVAMGAGWLDALAASEWTLGRQTAVRALAAAALLTVVTLVSARRDVILDRLLPWGALGTASLVTAGIGWVALDVGGGADARLAAIAVAVSMATVAALAAVSARRLWWPVLTWVSCVATAWSWAAVTSWAALPSSGVATAIALAAGSMALSAAVLLRRGRLGREWIVALGCLTGTGLVTAVVLVTAVDAPGTRHPAALAVAGGLALLTVAAGIAARPLGWSALREGAAVLGVAAAAMAAYDWQPSVGRSVSAAVAAAALTLLVALALWRATSASAWFRPLAVATSLFGAAALVLAFAALPDRSPLIAATLVVAAEAAAAGITLRGRRRSMSRRCSHASRGCCTRPMRCGAIRTG